MADDTGAAQAPQPQFNIRRIYLKDMSFESPRAPQIFDATTQPQIDLQLGAGAAQIGENLHEVVVNVTATVRSGEDTVFLVEVQQGGIFLVRGFANNAERGAVLGGYCPSLLFPFAREAVCDFVQKAGFPQLLLQPINFEAMYLDHLNRQRAEGGKVILDPTAAAQH